MRISDWSSDVCSSDLIGGGTVLWGDAEPKGIKGGKEEKGKHRPDYNAPDQHDGQFSPECRKRQWGEGQHCGQSRQKHRAGAMNSGLDRSEEHTSELQSLMRISYAVFSLKKKNTKKR